MSWAEQLVAELAAFKKDGVPFDRAWQTAIRKHPPRGRDVGEPAEDLFAWAEQRDREPTLVEFTRKCCWDAWHGKRPELRFVPVLKEPGEVFPIAEARQETAHRHRAA